MLPGRHRFPRAEPIRRRGVVPPPGSRSEAPGRRVGASRGADPKAPGILPEGPGSEVCRTAESPRSGPEHGGISVTSPAGLFLSEGLVAPGGRPALVAAVASYAEEPALVDRRAAPHRRDQSLGERLLPDAGEHDPSGRRETEDDGRGSAARDLVDGAGEQPRLAHRSLQLNLPGARRAGAGESDRRGNRLRPGKDDSCRVDEDLRAPCSADRGGARRVRRRRGRSRRV